MKKILILFLLLVPFQAQAQPEPPPKVTINETTCGRFEAMVVNVPAGAPVRFQLGHDLVKIVNVTEQDTVAQFKSGPFPASDWGFSVRIGEQELFNEIVTVKPCAGQNPDRLLEVTQFDCQEVSVLGNGWMPTEATIEVKVGEAIKQVQPSSEGVFHTTLDWSPSPGQYNAMVLIDNIEQPEQSKSFAVSGCGELPFTGTRSNIMIVLLAAVLLLGGLVLILLGRKNRA